MVSMQETQPPKKKRNIIWFDAGSSLFTSDRCLHLLIGSVAEIEMC